MWSARHDSRMLTASEPARRPRPRRRLPRTLQLAAVRVGQGWLRRPWAAAYELLTRLLASYLRRGSSASVYVKGSFGRGEPVFGLSDIGLIAVVAGDARDRHAMEARAVLHERWERLTRRLRPLSWLVRGVPIYPEQELPELASTCFRYGLRETPPVPLFAAPERSIRLATLPGLWPMEDWRLLAGPDVRPRIDAADPALRRLAVTLELMFWWTQTFRAAAEPGAHWAPYHCVKLIAEPARILLWLEHGERYIQREPILCRSLEAFPEERPAFEYALELKRSLHRHRVAPLATVLPSFVRLSARIVAWLHAELEPIAGIEVGLEGAPGAPLPSSSPLPLCDWRALVRAPGSEESFAIEPGRVEDSSCLAGALARSGSESYPTLLHDGLILRPRPALPPCRALGFAACDPVSAALVEGRERARFPEVPGWSARDVSARAVAEHGGWLHTLRPVDANATAKTLRTRLAGSFCAARAASFRESLGAGAPAIPVTFAAVAGALASRAPASSGIVSDAYGSYRELADAGVRPSADTVNALTELVKALDSYAR
jgi:hypothetical protein